MNSFSHQRYRLIISVIIGSVLGFSSVQPLTVTAQESQPKASEHRESRMLAKVKDNAYPTQPQHEVKILK